VPRTAIELAIVTGPDTSRFDPMPTAFPKADWPYDVKLFENVEAPLTKMFEVRRVPLLLMMLLLLVPCGLLSHVRAMVLSVVRLH
jgi:hypothetical protein